MATWEATAVSWIAGFASFSVSPEGIIAYGSRRPIPLSQLVWLDRQGKRLGTVGQTGNIAKIALSPDERRVAVEFIEGEKREIRVLDVGTGAAFPLLAYQQGVTQLDPVWSPDSRRVAVGSYSAGVGEIREINVSSLASTLLYTDETAKFLDDWTSDGRYIAYHYEFGNRALPLGGKRIPIELQQGTRTSWDQVTFSPDGHWIAFNSPAPDPDVFIASFPSLSERRQVSVGGGFQPQWAKDGKELFFISPKGTLMSAPIRQGPGSTLVSRVPKPLFALGLSIPAWTQYQVSSDGRFLAIQPVMSVHADLIQVIVNWPALVRR